MGSKEKSCVQTARPVAAMPPDEGVRELVAVGISAEQAGWLPREAFEAALLLRISGMPTHVSIAAFLHAARWRQ
jgi:hypothetical protein